MRCGWNLCCLVLCGWIAQSAPAGEFGQLPFRFAPKAPPKIVSKPTPREPGQLPGVLPAAVTSVIKTIEPAVVTRLPDEAPAPKQNLWISFRKSFTTPPKTNAPALAKAPLPIPQTLQLTRVDTEASYTFWNPGQSRRAPGADHFGIPGGLMLFGWK